MRVEKIGKFWVVVKYLSRPRPSRVIKHHSKKANFTDKAPIGDKERFSTVARSSSTDAEMGAVPLFSGFISTWIFRSISSSLSLSELE